MRTSWPLVVVGLLAACGTTEPIGQSSHPLVVCPTDSGGKPEFGCCNVDGDCPNTACRTQACDPESHLCKVTADTCTCLLNNSVCDTGNLCSTDQCVILGGGLLHCTHTPI